MSISFLKTSWRRPPSLAPLLRERAAQATRPGWSRTVHARRAVAGLLVLLAAWLAVRADPALASTEVVVAARDLPPGRVLAAGDLNVAEFRDEVVPTGAATGLATVVGRTTAGAVRAGEAMTDVRVVGPSLAALATGRTGSTSVPVRLSDAAVAALLRPGDEVDVLVLGEGVSDVQVLAQDAVVLAVPPADERRTGRGRLLVLGLPPQDAAAVAAAALKGVVTVTFH